MPSEFFDSVFQEKKIAVFLKAGLRVGLEIGEKDTHVDGWTKLSAKRVLNIEKTSIQTHYRLSTGRNFSVHRSLKSGPVFRRLFEKKSECHANALNERKYPLIKELSYLM